MSTADYVILLVIALCLFFAIRYMIKQRKSGKCIGCSQCTLHGECDKCKKAKND